MRAGCRCCLLLKPGASTVVFHLTNALCCITRTENNEYWVGDIVDSKTFAPTSRGVLDFGMYYAARTGSTATASLDGTERRVIFGATGWAPPRSLPGCQPHSSMQIEMMPRDLGVDAKGRLTISPIPELATLRKPGSRTSAWLDSQQPAPSAAAAKGSLLDLRMSCKGRPTGASDAVAMNVLVGPGGTTFTTIGYNYSSSQLFIDHRQSSSQCPDRVTCGPDAIVQTAPLQGGGLDAGEPVELTVLLDGGLVEAYLNNRTVMSVWVVEVMNSTAAGLTPASRTAAALTPPAGVTCHWESHELQALPYIPA
jgi:sucrose-6-phosphate hydrolase SacC (GH32 family)